MFDLRRGFMEFSLVAAIMFWASFALGSESLGDPTRPPSQLADTIELDENLASSNLELRAIIFAEGRRVAIINDQRVVEHDSIGAARVIEIMADRVLIRKADHDTELVLLPTKIKIPNPRSKDESQIPSSILPNRQTMIFETELRRGAVPTMEKETQNEP